MSSAVNRLLGVHRGCECQLHVLRCPPQLSAGLHGQIALATKRKLTTSLTIAVNERGDNGFVVAPSVAAIPEYQREARDFLGRDHWSSRIPIDQGEPTTRELNQIGWVEA